MGRIFASLVFIDLKKATFDHKIICKTLELLWCSGMRTLVVLILSHQRQKTYSVNGVDSEIGDIDVAVPQGSYLGPFLFLVYINDIPQDVQVCTVSMNVYDTNLWYQPSDITH